VDPKKIAEIEIDVLLEAIRLRYDYDFKSYARASLNRRVQSLLTKENLEMPYQLIPRILYDHTIFDKFLSEMSVTVTEFFRDPPFFKAIQDIIFPVLQTYPYVKIWHAGCATGEEVYSLAILLKEAGLLNKAKIYATDYNKRSLEVAKEGIYSTSNLEANKKAYLNAGGEKSLDHYYTEQYEAFKFQDSLKENMTFAYHNLVKDGVFGEMNIVICRNVLIYFDKDLQDHAFTLFNSSLVRKGFMCLGSKETIDYSAIKDQYETFSKPNKIFRRKN